VGGGEAGRFSQRHTAGRPSCGSRPSRANAAASTALLSGRDTVRASPIFGAAEPMEAPLSRPEFVVGGAEHRIVRGGRVGYEGPASQPGHRVMRR